MAAIWGQPKRRDQSGGLAAKQVSWLNIKYITEDVLEQAIVRVINAYNKFELPNYWGSGKHVSADGTKWNLYEQNLISEYHIRYGAMVASAITMSRISSLRYLVILSPAGPMKAPIFWMN
jgi:TnpA family transposase